MIAIANCIIGPQDLADWVVDEYRKVLSTLTDVPGFHDFYLRELGLDGPECTFASLTTWDDLEDFRAWRQSATFMESHRARMDRERFGRLNTPRRYDFEIDGKPDIEELDALVLARLIENGHATATPESRFTEVLNFSR